MMYVGFAVLFVVISVMIFVKVTYPLVDSENIVVYQHGTTIETKPVIYCAHTTNPKQDNKFVFKYIRVGDRWRAYVLRAPDHEGRKWDDIYTHLDPDWGNLCKGYRHVDWEQPIKSLDDMQKVAHLWADLCLRYIETGKGFNT